MCRCVGVACIAHGLAWFTTRLSSRIARTYTLPLSFFFLYASAVTGDRDLAVLIQVIFYAVSGVFYACGFIACIWLLRNVDKYFSQTKVCPCGH